MANEIILPKNFDIAKLSYGAVKQQSTGGKSVWVGYNGGRCVLQTPEMKAPFGISVWPSDNGGPDKYSVDLSFEGREGREAVQALFDVLNAIDTRLVQDAMDNSQLWFKKKFPSVDVVHALYSPTVRYSKDKDTGEINTKYAPTFKASIPFKDGNFLVPAFGANRAEINLKDIIDAGTSKGARVRALVQITGIWMVGSKFGLTCKVQQLILSESSRLGKEFAFQPTDEDTELLEQYDDIPVAVVRRLDGPPAAAAAAAAAAATETKGGGGPRTKVTASTATSKRMVLPESDDEGGVEEIGALADDEDGIEP